MSTPTWVTTSSEPAMPGRKWGSAGTIRSNTPTSSRSWRRCEMARYDVRIITASYRREPRNAPEPAQLPVIQIFGRTREGQSITIEYSGFQPYFFVVEPPQSLRGAFGRDSQVVKLEDGTLERAGWPNPCG